MSPEELFEQNMHLAEVTINRMYNNPVGICRKHRIEYDDLLQYARTGLWKACLGFNENKGVKFTSFAISNIKWHLNERLNRETSIIKYNPNRPCDPYRIISMDVEIDDDSSTNTYHDIVPDESINILENVMGNLGGEHILSRLTDKQRRVVELKAKGLNGAEIGRILNMTSANAREHFNKSKLRLMKYQLGVV